MFVLSIDAGGTSTKCVLYDAHQNKLKELLLSSIHPMHTDLDKMIETLTDARDIINHPKTKIVLGLAGYGLDQSLKKKTDQAMSEVFKKHKYQVVSDVELALKAALGNSDGIFLISGTGSIAFSQKDGYQKRSGGWGSVIGDEGSAFWIGKQIINQFSKQADQIQNKTELFDDVMEYFELNTPNELVLKTRDLNKTQIAMIAQLAFKKPKVYKSILDEAARLLSETLGPLLKDFSSTVPIYVYGGVFENCDQLIEQLNKYIAPYTAKLFNKKAQLGGLFIAQNL